VRKSNFALRLQPSLLDEARKLAAAEGVALNQLINVAVAEKVSALRTETYIAERAARADMAKALRVLKRAGVGRAAMQGDEVVGIKRKRRPKRRASVVAALIAERRNGR
jgi:hypothetical protein